MRLSLYRGMWLVAAVIALAVFAACQAEEAPPAGETPGAAERPAPFPVTVTDSNGNEVTFQTAPQRIVSLSAGHTESLFALGAAQQVVAVDKFSDYPPEAATRPQLDAYEPNLEAITAFQPDLVVIFFDPGDLQTSLERLGIKVLFLAAPQSVDGVFQQILLLGQVTGHNQEAEELVAAMRSPIEAIQEKLADIQQGPRIFHELDPQFFTVGPGSFVDDLYRTLKAQNIAADTGEAYPQLSQEAIIEKDPEVIILADEPAGITAQSVKARPGWQNIAAVKNDRIYVVDPDLVSRPGPRLVEALQTLAQLLYPERFQ